MADWWASLSQAEKHEFITENPAQASGSGGIQYAMYDEFGRSSFSLNPADDPNAVPISGISKEAKAKWDPVGTAELDAQLVRFRTWSEASGYEEDVEYGKSGQSGRPGNVCHARHAHGGSG